MIMIMIIRCEKVGKVGKMGKVGKVGRGRGCPRGGQGAAWCSLNKREGGFHISIFFHALIIN